MGEARQFCSPKQSERSSRKKHLLLERNEEKCIWVLLLIKDLAFWSSWMVMWEGRVYAEGLQNLASY